MAESHDENPHGRLLFTDFDASDKGRPVAVFGDLVPPADVPALHIPDALSLEHFASTLDLDFEDDTDPVMFDRAPADFASDADEADVPNVSNVLDVSDILDSSGPDMMAPPSFEPAPFREIIPVAEEKSEPRDVVAGERLSGDSSFAVANEGYAELDDLLTEEGEDVDILSIIPPAPAISEESEPYQARQPHPAQYRGSHLGVEPPRSNPYGGLTRLAEWFRPPEPGREVEEGRVVQSVENWYEPPEDYLPGDALFSKRSGEKADDSTDVVGNSGSDTRKSTRRFELFDSMDLDAAWREKSGGAKGAHAESRSGSLTAEQDVFSGMDIDAIWDSRPASKSDAGDTVVLNRKPGAAAGDTVVLNRKPDAADGDAFLDTASVERNDWGGGPAQSFEDMYSSEETVPAAHWEDEWRGLRHDEVADDNPELIDADNAIGFLNDLDDIASDSPPSASAARAEEAEETEKAAEGDAAVLSAVPGPGEEEGGELGRARREDENSGGENEKLADGELDIDALIAKADTVVDAVKVRDIEAPIIHDADIDTDTQRIEREVHGRAVSDEADDPFALPKHIPANDQIVAPVVSDDDLEMPAASSVSDDAGDEKDESAEAGVAVNPLDVFANMDDMDFSDDDGLDDEMRAMLEEDESESPSGESDGEPAAGEQEEAVPADVKGKIFYYARKARKAVFSHKLFTRALAMIAWKENWWFYCDLVAALIASASLAVILSYYIWYR